MTNHLLDQLHQPSLTAWVRAWDQLEALVVGVYKRKRARPGERVTYFRLKWALSRAYPAHRKVFEPHWSEADPFEEILKRKEAGRFVGDWAAIQTLPAARQAINLGLLDRLAASAGSAADPGLS